MRDRGDRARAHAARHGRPSAARARARRRRTSVGRKSPVLGSMFSKRHGLRSLVDQSVLGHPVQHARTAIDSAWSRMATATRGAHGRGANATAPTPSRSRRASIVQKMQSDAPASPGREAATARRRLRWTSASARSIARQKNDQDGEDPMPRCSRCSPRARLPARRARARAARGAGAHGLGAADPAVQGDDGTHSPHPRRGASPTCPRRSRSAMPHAHAHSAHDAIFISRTTARSRRRRRRRRRGRPKASSTRRECRCRRRRPECDAIVAEAEEFAPRAAGRRRATANFPTTDLPLKELPN